MENNEKHEQTQELTIKQHKFVRGYLEGKPMVRAATEAGTTHHPPPPAGPRN